LFDKLVLIQNYDYFAVFVLGEEVYQTEKGLERQLLCLSLNVIENN